MPSETQKLLKVWGALHCEVQSVPVRVGCWLFGACRPLPDLGPGARPPPGVLLGRQHRHMAMRSMIALFQGQPRLKAGAAAGGSVEKDQSPGGRTPAR